MQNITRTAALLLTTTSLTVGCAVTSHDVTHVALGQSTSTSSMLAEIQTPGPVKLTRVTAAHWAVDRSGLINLDHPEAEAHGLEDGDDDIDIYFYVLEHPTHGTWLVDSGVATVFRDDPDNAPVSAMVSSAMNIEALDVLQPTAAWLEAHPDPVEGVLLTHLHLDHIMGMPDIPADIPVYTGPGEADATLFINMFVQGTTDDLLGERPPLRELAFSPDPDGDLTAILDLFGDGSVYALHVPGHTPGSLAFLIRTPQGPQLITGDASHTTWGWDHHVEPGTFNGDTEAAARSLAKLKALEARIPHLTVHIGHQHHAEVVAAP